MDQHAKISRYTWLGLLCLLLSSSFAAARPQSSAAQGKTICGNGLFTINETLPNGARWAMCWEERAIEGIVLRNIQYTSPAGEQRFILAQANLAQVHVPYDDNSDRFHDLSDYGMGGNNLANLTAQDCPGGTLLSNNGKNGLCQTIAGQGYAYKYYTVHKQSSALVLFSVSYLGRYNYITQWTFGDDGSIQPAVGATGKLQKCTTDARFGWPLSPACPRGTSHTHNYYWRLDFDLVGVANNVVEMLEFSGDGTALRPVALHDYAIETAAQVAPGAFRSWRIKNTGVKNSDAHVMSYELLGQSEHIFRGPSFEPWTKYDVYVTQYKLCEKWVSHNPITNGCGDNVSQFVDNQPLVDPILWYGTTFHHLARDEDEPLMSTHWSYFTLQPRDMEATQGR
jgi:primary-amine oxidase